MVKLAREIFRDFVTEAVPASGAHKPIKADIRDWGSYLEGSSQMRNNPISYGATGDGTTNDSVNYGLAEDDNDQIWLPIGSTFNLGTALPEMAVYGPGRIKITNAIIGTETVNATIGGLQPIVFPHRSSMYFKPSDMGIADWLYDTFPVGSGHGNTVFGVGALNTGTIAADGSSDTTTRTTVFGSLILTNVVDADRIDAFGQSALRYMRYGERNTAIGTLSMQWGGSNLSLDTTGHYYNHDLIYNAGVPVTDPLWNAEGLETTNPGIRAAIVAWLGTNPWATLTTDFERNIGVGRDSGVEMIRGSKNTNLGYRTGGLMLAGDFNTNVGSEAGRNNIFGGGNTNVGVDAGYSNQTGSHNVAIGREALHDFITGTRNIGIGYKAGLGCFGTDNNIFIGAFSGNQDAGDTFSARLYIQPVAAAPYIIGDMTNGKLGFGTGITWEDLALTDGLYIRQGAALGGAAPVSTARMIVLESATSTGITIKTANTAGGAIAFADPEGNVDGRVFYDHATRTMELRASNFARVTIGAGTINFNGAAPYAIPTYGLPTGVFTRTTFATTTVTLPQLAERVAALIQDLKGEGLAI